MAAPSYSTNLVDITTAETTTGWSAFGGGGAGLSASPDLAVQGTNAVDKQVTNSEKGQYFDNGATITPGADEHFYIWGFMSTPGLLDTKTNRGLAAYMSTGGGSDYVQFHLTGSNVFQLSEVVRPWVIRYVNTASTGLRTVSGTPGTAPRYFGMTTATVASVKGANLGVDVIRRGDIVRAFAGDSGTPITLAAFAIYADATTRRWGILRPSPTGVELQGKMYIGNVSGITAGYSRDSNKTITFLAAEHALSTLNAVIFELGTTDVEWDNVGITALGTNARGRIEINNNAKVWWTNSVFAGINTTAGGGTNTKFDGCTWRGTNAVTAAGGSYLNCSYLVPTVAANTSVLVYNVATDPDGVLDGSTFTKGTNAHHAIEFGTASPLTMTLRDIDFSGFSASNNVNDSAVHIKRTSGTVTLNVVGGSGTVSYRTDGATVNVVANPVALTVTVLDATDLSTVSGARVYIKAETGGDMPYQTAISITRSGSTATVTHTAHGMSTNDWARISGATQTEYNGLHQITVTGVNSYTYTVSGTPVTPATGSPICTGVLINAISNGSGVATFTRTYSVNQPFSGYARKSTTSPLYAQGPTAGSVDKTNGTSATIVLIPDE